MSTHPMVAGHSPRFSSPHPEMRHSPVSRKATHPRGGAWKWGAAAFGAGIVAAIAAGLFGTRALDDASLMQRMEAAAFNRVQNPVAAGPEVWAERSDDSIIVHAKGVVPRDCVSAGWQLARKGVLSINGTTPQRVSSAILTELCNQDVVAEIRWVPRKAP